MIAPARSLFSEATSNFVLIPTRQWHFLACAAVIAFGSDVAGWLVGMKFAWWMVPFLLVSTMVALAAVFVGSMDLLGRQPSWDGFGRFGTISLIIFAPGIIGLALLWYGVQKPSSTEMIVTGAICFFLCIIALALLPAWPLAQALSQKTVSVCRVWAATKGHRLSLVMLSLLLGAVNGGDLVPDVKETSELWQVIGIGLIDAAVTVLSISLTASIAVSAYRFALRNDDSLSAD